MARPFSHDWEQKVFGYTTPLSTGLRTSPSPATAGPSQAPSSSSSSSSSFSSSFASRPRPSSESGIPASSFSSMNGGLSIGVGSGGEPPNAGRPVSDSTRYASREAEAIDLWFEDLNNYERTLEQMSEMTFVDNFKEEMQAVMAWFLSQNDCERTTIVYALLRQSSQLQIRFFLMVLQQMAKKDPIATLLSPRTSVNEMEKNNPELLGRVIDNEQQASKRLLEVLPSLRDDDIPSDSSDSFRLYNRHSVPERRRPPHEADHHRYPPSSSSSSSFEMRRSAPPTSHYVLSNRTLPTEPLKPTRPAPPIPGSSLAHGLPPSSGPSIPISVTAPSPAVANPDPVLHLSSSSSSFSSSSSLPPKIASPRGQPPASVSSPASQGTGESISSKVMNVLKRVSGSKSQLEDYNSSLSSSPPTPTSTSSTSSSSAPPATLAVPTPSLPLSNPTTPNAHQIPSSPNSSPASPPAPSSPSPSPSLNGPPARPAPYSQGHQGSTQGSKALPLRPTPTPPSPSPISGLNLLDQGEKGAVKAPAPNPPPPKSRSASPTPPNERLEPGTELDIATWLKGLRLHKYTTIFEEMSWEKMINLGDEELQNLGMAALGARRKILKEFEILKASGYPPVA